MNRLHLLGDKFMDMCEECETKPKERIVFLWGVALEVCDECYEKIRSEMLTGSEK